MTSLEEKFTNEEKETQILLSFCSINNGETDKYINSFTKFFVLQDNGGPVSCLQRSCTRNGWPDRGRYRRSCRAPAHTRSCRSRSSSPWTVMVMIDRQHYWPMSLGKSFVQSNNAAGVSCQLVKEPIKWQLERWIVQSESNRVTLLSNKIIHVFRNVVEPRIQ